MRVSSRFCLSGTPLPGVVAWKPAAVLPFECTLCSDSKEILRAASTLFAPWLIDATGPVRRPVRGARWLVEVAANVAPASGEATAWKVTGPDGISWTSHDIPALLMQIEYEAIRQLADGLEPGFTGFHGALLSKNGRGVLILGTKESGKSTLACALWRAGWSLLSDDCVLLDVDMQAHACARRVSLRNSARALLDPAQWQMLERLLSSLALPNSLLFHPHECDAGSGPRLSAARAVPLDALVFLGRYGAGAGTEGSRPVPRAQAAISLLAHSSLLWKDSNTAPAPRPEEWMALLPRVVPMAEAVPAYDVFRDELLKMVAVVEKIAAKGAL